MTCRGSEYAAYTTVTEQVTSSNKEQDSDRAFYDALQIRLSRGKQLDQPRDVVLILSIYPQYKDIVSELDHVSNRIIYFGTCCAEGEIVNILWSKYIYNFLEHSPDCMFATISRSV